MIILSLINYSSCDRKSRCLFILKILNKCKCIENGKNSIYLSISASLNGNFMKGFMTLNIINFADIVRREKDRVSWDMMRVSSL